MTDREIVEEILETDEEIHELFEKIIQDNLGPMNKTIH